MSGSQASEESKDWHDQSQQEGLAGESTTIHETQVLPTPNPKSRDFLTSTSHKLEPKAYNTAPRFSDFFFLKKISVKFTNKQVNKNKVNKNSI